MKKRNGGSVDLEKANFKLYEKFKRQVNLKSRLLSKLDVKLDTILRKYF